MQAKPDQPCSWHPAGWASAGGGPMTTLSSTKDQDFMGEGALVSV